MICVGHDPTQHDYEPTHDKVNRQTKVPIAVCRKCGKTLWH